jgi:DNA-binding CsgD family transcriptional regulator/pimeloyl-ACP methyl ester carboxylesterase
MDAPPVQYVRTSDGFSIAYRVSGAGDPWVIVPPGFHHLHVALEEQSMRSWIAGLGERFMLVRYDTRGQGLSTRGLPDTHQMADYMRDLQAVLDRLDMPPAVLHGQGSSAHVAVRFAALHPERVRALVLVHCSITSEPWPRALMELVANADWETFLRTMTLTGPTPSEAQASRERLRQMVAQEDFKRMFHAYRSSDIREELTRLRMPALVLHLKESERPSLQEAAELASLIPGARFAEIERSAAPWFWGDFDSAIPLIEDFLAGIPAPADSPLTPDAGPPATLSVRELEVLRLLAAGRSNQQIADDLVISLNTVRRHVSNIFDKTGAQNRAQAAVYAKDHGLA